MAVQSRAGCTSVWSFVKFVFWAAAAAAIEYATVNLTSIKVPAEYKLLTITVLAAALKAAATWIQTKRNEKAEANL